MSINPQSLNSLQGDFALALRQADHEIPDAVTSQQTRHPVKRFNVYRNNVFASLIDVLRGRFPAVDRLLGEEFFNALAAEFIRTHPPKDPVIIHYGRAFPAFLQGFEPVADVPYLPDVARIELAWNEAYHAQDATPLPMEALAQIAPDDLAGMVLHLHPSLNLVGSSYPAFSIWEYNQAENDMNDMPDIDLQSGGEDVMVLRPHHKVNVARLPVGAFAFIRAILERKPLGVAVDLAVADTPSFDLQINLAGLMQNHAISHFNINPM